MNTARIFFFFTIMLACLNVYAEVFRLHLFTEPQNLDPQTTSAASGNYLFHNLYRGLYRYDNVDGLVFEDAESCIRKKTSLTCKLRPLKWSDGSVLDSSHYLASFRRLIDPNQRSTQSDVLFTIRNARQIWAGKMKPEKLGISAPDPQTLIFEFSESDPEFEYKLIHPALSPLPKTGYLNREQSSKMPVNGPYRVESWKTGSRVKLVPNIHYTRGHAKRPNLETLFIEEDSTALRLYESGKLDFLRRLVSTDVARLKNSPEYKEVPMARFDYVGFGPELAGEPDLREALISGVDYADFLKLFESGTTAGCPSLPSRFYTKVACLKFDPARAARALAKSKSKSKGKLELQFSRMGGDDIARAAEWFQGQWKRNLKLKVELSSQEQGIYLKRLRSQPPEIFRKGVSLDRPTCLAALEIFSRHNPENYLRLNDAKYEKLLNTLATAPNEEIRKKRCSDALKHLLASHRLIPLGEMHFKMLAKKRFQGWRINELNQLDLSQLHVH